jgi:hypothetical protein
LATLLAQELGASSQAARNLTLPASAPAGDPKNGSSNHGITRNYTETKLLDSARRDEQRGPGEPESIAEISYSPGLTPTPSVYQVNGSQKGESKTEREDCRNRTQIPTCMPSVRLHEPAEQRRDIECDAAQGTEARTPATVSTTTVSIRRV